MPEQSIFTPAEYAANFKKNKNGKKEESLQLQICDYLRNTYPDLIWFCDLASGAKLPIWIAAKNAKMRSSRGLPDLFIAHPSESDGGSSAAYSGLFLEIKREGVVVKLKNGDLPADKHLREQAAILKRLNSLGFEAKFACGYTEAVEIIKNYLSK